MMGCFIGFHVDVYNVLIVGSNLYLISLISVFVCSENLV